jgi:glycosyltransferase involved in cell wall biosynthesis
MRLSIAMASYNGARFIGEQLQSFAGQSRPPVEVVICDDGSTDDTARIVADFAARAGFPVRFHRNPERLGYARNFERAVLLCQGDIVFLSDQDDVWLPEKLEAVAAAFEADPAAQVVANDQILTDGELRHDGITKLANLRRLGIGPDGLIEGCCTAFRRSWAELLLPIPAEAQPLIARDLQSHDRWINELSILLGVRRMIARPLQYFRRYGSNTTDWVVSEPRAVGIGDLVASRMKTAPIEGWRDRVRVLALYQSWLAARRPALEAAGGAVGAALAEVAREKGSLEARIDLVQKPLPLRLALIAALLARGGYRYFYGWKSALRDIARSVGESR